MNVKWYQCDIYPSIIVNKTAAAVWCRGVPCSTREYYYTGLFSDPLLLHRSTHYYTGLIFDKNRFRNTANSGFPT